MCNSGFVSTSKHGGNFGGPYRMLEGETNGGPGSARGTPANGVHNHEHGPALWSKKLVYIFSEIAPHRSNELFRVGHTVILHLRVLISTAPGS